MHEDCPPPPRQEPTRDQRLAAKLRENLRRRKDQARSMDGAAAFSKGEVLPKDDSSS